MTNYRRLISYIYAYEGGIKGKNVGFAKLEVRNGQCKIQVNVRNVFIGSQDTGVYLLSGTEEILVGKIFIRNGAGEFRAMVSVNNVAGSGQTIDQCYGLTVHNLADSWQSYTTIWEDAVAHAAEVALEEATSEQIERREQKENRETGITSSVARAVEMEIEAQSRQEERTRQKQPPVSPELSSVIPDPLSEKEPEDVGTMEIRPMEVKPIVSNHESGREAGSEEAESVGERQLADERDAGGQQKTEAGDTEPSKAEQQEPTGQKGDGQGQADTGQTQRSGIQEEGQQGSGPEMREETDVSDKSEPDATEEGIETEENAEAAVTAEKSSYGQMGQGRQDQRNLFGQPVWWGRPSPQMRRNPLGRQMVPQQPEPRSDAQSQLEAVSRPEVLPRPEIQPPPEVRPRPEVTPQPEVRPQPEVTPQPPEVRPRPEVTPQPPEVRPRPEVTPQPEIQPRPEASRQTAAETQSRPADLSQVQSQPRLEPAEEEPRIESIWQQFYKRYPKIQAFDYNGGCDILTIKPQDIGLLPREIWGYGNNSFLLHGYYSHRYIIFARLGGLKGRIRYLLGVPGHYYSNEKYMASMFGFPNFVLSKIQPEGDGRFGYWYTDVHLGS